MTTPTSLLKHAITSLLCLNCICSVQAEEKLTDQVVGLAVENELITSEMVQPHRIDVSCRGGVVTLSGKVDNLLARRRSVDLAKRVRGVDSVVNHIVVLYDGDEAKVAEDVREALAADPATELREVRVSADGGRVTLEATVSSLAERDLTVQTVEGVRGVTEIDNLMQVRHSQQRPDRELQEELQRLIDSSVEIDDADIKVEVRDGKALARGFVGSAYEKSFVEQRCQIAGIDAVDVNGIRVDSDRFDGMRRRARMTKLSDKEITDNVRLAMRHDARLISYLDGIKVDSDGGSVTLTGHVGRYRVKEFAAETARNTVGVWRVKNHLKVRWSGDDISARNIIDYVQAALKRDPYVDRHDIRVHCRNAHVTLYGLVDTQFEKEAAGWIAGGQKGVVHVNNSLAVAKKWQPKPDEEIQDAIEEKLKFTLFDRSNDIEVRVEDGVALLRGRVDTWRQWQAVMNATVAAGARRPHNMIRVRFHPRHGGSQIYVPH